MDREGRNKVKMRKCREWISLHFLFIFLFSLHFLAARQPQVVQPCTNASQNLSQHLKNVRIELVSWRQPVLSFALSLSPSSALSVALSFALSLSPPFALSLQTKFVSSLSLISCYLKCTRWSSPQLWWRKLLDGIHFISLSWRWINWSKELQLEIISLLLGWLGLG